MKRVGSTFAAALGFPAVPPAPTSAQKQIASLNVKNATPADFQPIAGAILPVSVTLEDKPKTIAELLPQMRGFKAAMIAGRVVPVEPQSRRIVETITGEKS